MFIYLCRSYNNNIVRSASLLSYHCVTNSQPSCSKRTYSSKKQLAIHSFGWIRLVKGLVSRAPHFLGIFIQLWNVPHSQWISQQTLANKICFVLHNLIRCGITYMSNGKMKHWHPVGCTQSNLHDTFLPVFYGT